MCLCKDFHRVVGIVGTMKGHGEGGFYRAFYITSQISQNSDGLAWTGIFKAMATEHSGLLLCQMFRPIPC